MATLLGLLPLLVFIALWAALMLFLRQRQDAQWPQLLLVAIFGVYLYAVLDTTLLQYQSLLILKLFNPDLVLRGIEAGESLNLVPLAGLTAGHLRTSLLNILMLVPFGFGLPFITPFRFGRVVGVAALFSLAIECLQWLSGQLAGTTFRIADINDLIFNTLGAALGYLLFLAFQRLGRRVLGAGAPANPLLHHLFRRPQLPA